ncbi:hypothetical protein FQN60_010667, partial [Etheostoma spectabile]
MCVCVQGEVPARGSAMEGDCLSCMKYLMFIFNFFIFLGGSFLLGVGVWVLVDPMGFRDIVAANPLLFTGVYVILALGSMLFLLGFLGCCGAIRENKCLLLFLTREYFSRELKRHYIGNNNTDVFTSTWDAIMTTGCYSAVVDYFETYIYTAGALAIVVLTIE